MPAIGAGILGQVKEKARSAFGSRPCLSRGSKKDAIPFFMMDLNRQEHVANEISLLRYEIILADYEIFGSCLLH